MRISPTFFILMLFWRKIQLIKQKKMSAEFCYTGLYTNYSVSCSCGLQIECTVPMLITPAVSCSVPGSHWVSLLRFSLLARKLWVELRSVWRGLECGTERVSLGIISHLRGSELWAILQADSAQHNQYLQPTCQSPLWGELSQHPPQMSALLHTHVHANLGD